MTGPLRAVLLICAVLVLYFIVRKLKMSQIQVLDSVFWLFFSLSLVLLAVFPGIAVFVSRFFGFMAPSNFVFVYVIAVLVMRDFSNTVKIAKLREKVNGLIQEVALHE